MKIINTSATAAVIVTVFVMNSSAQDNSTISTNIPPKIHWQSSASAGLTLTKGNSDTTLFTLKLLTSRKDPINEFDFGADETYGENSGTKNADVTHGFGQWNHLFSDKFYGYVRADGLHDGIANIKYRATIGPGAGYYFIKEEQTTLAAEGGGSYVLQRLGNNDSTFATLRLAERFEHKFNSYGARVWQNVEFLPQVNQFDNYLINAEIGVEAAVTKNTNLQIYLDDNFDSKPASGRDENDIKLVSAISYKF